jgi:uncharacterized membrane protein HdeD (DUF308 family)
MGTNSGGSNWGGALTTTAVRYWWTILAGGVAAVLFGILALIWPHITLLALVLLFGFFAIVEGVAFFASASTASQHGRSPVWPIIGGLLGIAAGIVAFVWPGLTALVLLYIIAFWAILTGMIEIIASIVLRDEFSHAWLQTLGGVISVLFGILVLVRPGAGALALVWLIAIYAIVFGIVRIAFAFQVRSRAEGLLPGGRAGTPPATA